MKSEKVIEPFPIQSVYKHPKTTPIHACRPYCQRRAPVCLHPLYYNVVFPECIHRYYISTIALYTININVPSSLTCYISVILIPLTQTPLENGNVSPPPRQTKQLAVLFKEQPDRQRLPSTQPSDQLIRTTSNKDLKPGSPRVFTYLTSLPSPSLLPHFKNKFLRTTNPFKRRTTYFLLFGREKGRERERKLQHPSLVKYLYSIKSSLANQIKISK